ncbi:MAG: dihydrodipicolinate synthase family protein, partial [Bythopirellula sp.]
MPISLIAPPHTPFNERGDVNLGLIEPLAAHLARSRVSGVFVCGSTGEGSSLSVGERKDVSEAWVDASSKHGLDVIVHVGTNSQREAMELAAHSADLGVRAISSFAPSYFRPQSVDDLIGFFAPIADAAGDTPFYFYDIPA